MASKVGDITNIMGYKKWSGEVRRPLWGIFFLFSFVISTSFGKANHFGVEQMTRTTQRRKKKPHRTNKHWKTVIRLLNFPVLPAFKRPSQRFYASKNVPVLAWREGSHALSRHVRVYLVGSTGVSCPTDIDFHQSRGVGRRVWAEMHFGCHSALSISLALFTNDEPLTKSTFLELLELGIRAARSFQLKHTSIWLKIHQFRFRYTRFFPSQKMGVNPHTFHFLLHFY